MLILCTSLILIYRTSLFLQYSVKHILHVARLSPFGHAWLQADAVVTEHLLRTPHVAAVDIMLGKVPTIRVTSDKLHCTLSGACYLAGFIMCLSHT